MTLTIVPSPTTIDCEINARLMRCPLPLLKAKQALQRMAQGQVLRVVATDAGSVRDFNVWCRQGGLGLLSFVEQDGDYIYLIQKGSA